MEIAAIILALAIAMGQLHLQHAEIRRNGQINTLVHMTGMLKDKIDHDERIIQNMKTTGADWTGHANRVEDEWRPFTRAGQRKAHQYHCRAKGCGHRYRG